MRSVRAKLTVTTMLVMGCLLAALDLVVYFGAQRTMLLSVDHEMQLRGFGMAQPRRQGEPDGPPGLRGPDGPPDGRGPANRPGPMAGPSDLRPVIVHLGERPNPPANGLEGAPYDPIAVSRAEAGWRGFTDVTRDGAPIRVYTIARVIEGRPVAVVQLGYNMADIERSLGNLRSVLLVVVIPLGVLLAGVASLFLVGRLLRPLRQITGKAAEIGAGNLADRLPVAGEDEFAGLATTLNAMLGRLEDGFALEQQAKCRLEETVVQQRRFTADASHELKTPLAVVKANAGLALHKDANHGDAREALAEIDSAADRMSKLVNDLLILARVDAGRLSARFKRADLREIVENAVAQIPGAKGKVVLTGAASGPILGSTDDLERVFVNLIDNALRYGGEPVAVAFEVRNGEVVVSVSDKGPGIAAEHIEHLFDRFYRVDKSRSSETGGTGLGLAICKGVVEAHGGTIAVDSKEGSGTILFVTLPILS